MRTAAEQMWAACPTGSAGDSADKMVGLSVEVGAGANRFAQPDGAPWPRAARTSSTLDSSIGNMIPTVIDDDLIREGT
jgi:hypothetical protein